MKHTPGAMRAAEKIKKNEQFDLTIEEIAAIIDTEIGLRDRFAEASLEGIRAGKFKRPFGQYAVSRIWLSKEVAQLAYEDADAMLTEREK